ncbi:NrtA/SsuA/CpmA family ABC transporter substrate-binding protein [Aurantimonas sp. C2-6-R+9]|uniref:ABC transporter substrate-binding protein n=1 Tax=unclassified Aurantimonas TaxID=2638230 RepID=UPI002E16D9CD|nr:NrtA/SsuA/CpmA family ABC transporter substrate-binding protein [Aurantimonas sp. C2-6-R+9]
MKRRLISALLATVFAVGVMPVTSNSSQAEEEVNVAAGIALTWAPLYVADQQGLFEKYGVDAKVLLFPSGRTAQEAIVGGGVAWGTVAETPVVFASMNNLPVRIIGVMSTYEIFDLVATEEMQKLEDLKGKRVGYAQGTNAQVYLSRALKKAGLTFDDITGINLSPTDMVTSLANAQIDAFIWTEPHISQALGIGDGSFHTIRTPGLYVTYSGIVALQSTIDNNPEMLVNSLCAMKEATEYMKNNKDASITYLSERIKMDHAIVAKEWDRVPFEITLDKENIVKDMQQQAQWAIESGLLAAGVKLPDFDQVVVDTIFDEAKNCLDQ